MAAERLDAPGTELGPCTKECRHRDCALSRSMAAEKCMHCGRPIGFDVWFYGKPGALVHAECEDLARRAG